MVIFFGPEFCISVTAQAQEPVWFSYLQAACWCLSLLVLSVVPVWCSHSSISFVNEQQQPGASSLMMYEASAFLPVTDRLANVQGMQRWLMFAAASSCQYLTCSPRVNTSSTTCLPACLSD